MSKAEKSFLERNWLLVLAIVYLLLPVDLIPDSIPLLGNLDDAALIVINLLQKYAEWKKEQKSDEGDNVQDGV